MIICSNFAFGNTLDLLKLNDWRRASGFKRKLIIGLFEEDYLATNGVNYDLIEITRAEKLHEQFGNTYSEWA